MKNSFFLVIPRQQKNADLLASFEKNSINHWVSELPTGNASLATRLFYDYIVQCNAIDMSAQQRLEVLEVLRPHYLSVEETLRSRLISSGFPKGPNEQKILSVLVSIEKNFTIGYWMVVRELTYRDLGWLKGKNAALAIQRTIKGLSGIVITHYMMSLPVPGWVWIDIHSLYILSVNLKKEKNKVIDISSSMGKQSSIESCYKQVLLLSLAVPTGLMQKEVQQVYEFSYGITQLIEIEKKPVKSQDLQCIIQIDEDIKPIFEVKGNSSDSSMLYLNMLKLHTALKQAEKYSSVKEARFSSLQFSKISSGKLPEGLFDYVKRCWEGKVVKGASFFSDRLDRFIAIGLNSTHTLQSSSKDTEDSGEEILAQSHSETELVCEFKKGGVLSIGSLVSFRKTNEPTQKRFLGVVIKISIPKQKGQLAFELFALTPQSYSVTYQNVYSESKDDHHKALLYGVKNKKEEKSYIIMESFKLKDGDMVKLFMNNDNFLIVLGDRKNIGLGYWQFECRQIAEENIPADLPDKKGYDFL